ncbi:MAG: deoxyribose-phosphate aldolase [Chloroflexi bacterium]|nr:deoxyribose-phosphate aldolase [Chloroflexota bacterium]
MENWTPLELVRKMDLLLLAPQLARAEIEAGCELAIKTDCFAVVVKPHYIEHVRKVLKDSRVKVLSVVGFPHGGVSTATKMYAAQDLIQRGVDEIEMVINIGALRDHDDLAVKNDIQTVTKIARLHPVCVILEVGLLTDEEKVRACKLAEVAGASTLKTATDFSPGIVSPDDVRLLRATCPNLPVRAAGGIATQKAARQMLEAGAARIASANIAQIVNE